MCKQLHSVDMTKQLREVFDMLLCDAEQEDTELLKKFVQQLPGLVEIFEEVRATEQASLPKERDSHAQPLKELSKFYLSDIIALGKTLRKRHLWRLELQLLKDLPAYYEMYSLKQISSKLVPYLLTAIKEGTEEVSCQAVEVVMKWVRINHFNSYAKDLLKTLHDDFFLGSSFKLRLLFVRVFMQFSEVFSRYFMRLHLLQQAFSLAGDPVVQVRRRFVKFLPQIRYSIAPTDTENIQKFTDILNRLILDQDREVSDVRLLINSV